MRIALSAFFLLLAAPTAFPQAPDLREKGLDEIARVAGVMVDGDVCQRIVTPRTLRFIFHEDPRDKWLAGDNYDVDHRAFTETKKTLRRLSLLASFPCDVNLWMPLEGQPGKIHIVVRNVNEWSQFWPWGALYQQMSPQMKVVLETGRRITVKEKPGWISVLAPVFNSLGDVVGLVEAVTNTTLDGHENVK